MQTSNLGLPRIGPRRELKRALEAFWSGKLSESELVESAGAVRTQNLTLQSAYVDVVACNDFSLYDHVLDMAVMLGAGDSRVAQAQASLAAYFELARGAEGTALEMTKWFDTNYHYLVPELARDQNFAPDPRKALVELAEALDLGLCARPVLLGPVTFLMLSRRSENAHGLGLLARLLPAFAEILNALYRAGASTIQIDEPVLVRDPAPEIERAMREAYGYLAKHCEAKLSLTTYFGGLGDNLRLALELPVSGLHVDLVEAPFELESLLAHAPRQLALSLGIIDGRNIFRADLERALSLVERAAELRGLDRLLLAPSCSLLHCPIDLEHETRLGPSLRSMLAFAKQKLEELALVAQGLRLGRSAIGAELEASRAARREFLARGTVSLDSAENEQTKARSVARTDEIRFPRPNALGLPLLPTTTIGSFPQTKELRQARARYKRGELSQALYESQLKADIRDLIAKQTELGLDVLVHGEPERNDMVEYFAEQLSGVALTENGWVQSYGSRCVKPPIIHGTVSRPRPMTLDWIGYAQSLTEKPVKAILTGPVTMLKWSFVRDDQPRQATCREMAWALCREVEDLAQSGVGIIQIDEPALREGLPLKHAAQAEYLAWAVECFKITASGAPRDVQVHSHMCYADFEDIIEAIVGLDVDVISLEAARSGYAPIAAFARSNYPNALGPGLYDIHSPKTPTQQELEQRLRLITSLFPVEKLWINPDCGLKTRAPNEVFEALRNMVSAVRTVRDELKSSVSSEKL